MNNLTLALVPLLLSATPVSIASSNTPPSPRIAAVVAHLAPTLRYQEVLAIEKGFTSVKRSGACKTDWKVLIAVAYTESSLKRTAMNKKTNDFGLMQVNYKTAIRMHLSTIRLMKDLAYNIQAGCSVIDENRTNYANRYPYWLGFYRSGVRVGNPSTVRTASRYSKTINRKVQEIQRLAKEGESLYVN